MKIFNKFFKKDHDLSFEEQEKFQNMINTGNSENTYSDDLSESFNFEFAISRLSSFEELNRIRNLLDKREKEIESGTSYLVDSEIKNSDVPDFEESIPIKSNSVTEMNIEEDITEDDLNNETYEDNSYKPDEIKDDLTYNDDKLNQFEENNLEKESPELNFDSNENLIDKKEDSFDYDELDKEDDRVEIPNEILEESEEPQKGKIKFDLEDEQEDKDFVELESVQPAKNVESVVDDKFSIESDMFYSKVKDIFGEENIVKKVEESSNLDLIKNKKVLHLGLREKNKFLEESNMIEENTWFITHIKQLDDLKNFKMIKSDKGMKDLLWDRGDYAIIISFRATTFLTSIEDFDFEI